MTTVVIMPGGFHPFHPGHLALYQSAQRTFPDAEVYVAATNDKSDRPFDISDKQKIAYAAGVEPGHFVQVKSPFQAMEITSQYNPDRDTVIFVRSEIYNHCWVPDDWNHSANMPTWLTCPQ